jgi:hypothetical protein
LSHRFDDRPAAQLQKIIEPHGGALPEPVRALVDGAANTSRRGLRHLTGTRAGGFVLTREEAAGKWGAATYSLVRT